MKKKHRFYPILLVSSICLLFSTIDVRAASSKTICPLFKQGEIFGNIKFQDLYFALMPDQFGPLHKIDVTVARYPDGIIGMWISGFYGFTWPNPEWYVKKVRLVYENLEDITAKPWYTREFVWRHDVGSLHGHLVDDLSCKGVPNWLILPSVFNKVGSWTLVFEFESPGGAAIFQALEQ